MAQRIFAPNIRPTKNPPVRPYFKNKIFTKKNCCSFSARKHPTPPGTGTEPGSSSGLGAAPAPGTRQFSQALLAVGPPVITDPREKKPGKPQDRTRPRFCFFYHSFQGFFQQKKCPNFYFSKDHPNFCVLVEGLFARWSCNVTVAETSAFQPIPIVARSGAVRPWSWSTAYD